MIRLKKNISGLHESDEPSMPSWSQENHNGLLYTIIIIIIQIVIASTCVVGKVMTLQLNRREWDISVIMIR